MTDRRCSFMVGAAPDDHLCGEPLPCPVPGHTFPVDPAALAARYTLIEPLDPRDPNSKCLVYLTVEQQSFCVTREPVESPERARWFASMLGVALAKVIALEAPCAVCIASGTDGCNACNGRRLARKENAS